MGVGPVDVVIIGFPGNKFTGRIAPALLELVDRGTIRVIDLLFVSKDVDGTLTTIAAADLEQDAAAGFVAVDIVMPGALGADDADEVSDDIPAGSSALVVAFENLWAAEFVDACRAADGFVIDQIRIPADVAEAVVGAGAPSPTLTS